MALTPAQQLLADVAQQGVPSNCCLSLGGYVEPDDEGNDVCFLDYAPVGVPSQFYLQQACGQIQSMLPQASTPGTDQNGQIYEDYVAPVGNWLSENTQNILDFFNPNPTPPPGYTATYIPNQTNGDEDNTVLYIVVGAVLLLVAFLLYRKFKK